MMQLLTYTSELSLTLMTVTVKKLKIKLNCISGVIVALCFVLQCSTGVPIDKGKYITKEGVADKIIELSQEIEALRKRVVNLEVNMAAEIKVDLTVPDADIQSNHYRRKRASRRRRRPEVAFQATLTKPSATFKILDAINFNNVVTNIGNAYNEQTGIFTAPTSGTYMFHTNIVAGVGHYVEASIKVNDRVIVSAISDHRVSDDKNSLAVWDQGNASSIIRLKKGDKVVVSIQWPQKNIVIHGMGKSRFSGYLLRAYNLMV